MVKQGITELKAKWVRSLGVPGNIFLQLGLGLELWERKRDYVNRCVEIVKIRV